MCIISINKLLIMKLKIIKSAIYITILASCNCAGIAMESNNNIINQNNNNTTVNIVEIDDKIPVLKPTIIKRLYKPNTIKRSKAPEPIPLTKEQELELMLIMHPEEMNALKYIDKWIVYIDSILEKLKK